MGGDQLLLLAHRVDEAEGVRAEAREPHNGDRDQAEERAERHARPCARAGGSEGDERKQKAGRHLHANPHRRHRRRCPQARLGAGREEQRDGHDEDHERVVVGAPDRKLQQHGVAAHERRRPATREPAAAGSKRRDGGGGEARQDGERLQAPEAACEAQRRREVAREREEGPVGGVLEGPADEPVDVVRGGFTGQVGVGVQPVDRSHASEGEVAEDVLGEERRAEEEDRVGEHDRPREHPHRDRPGPRQQEGVASTDEQREDLEAGVREGDVEAREGARQPRRPAPAAGRDELIRRRGGARGDEEGAREDRPQAEQGRRPQRPHGDPQPPRDALLGCGAGRRVTAGNDGR